MKLFGWIREIELIRDITELRRLYRLRRQFRKGKLYCSDCACQIHKHERYVITAARHRDYKDKKLVGQASLPARGDV